MSQVCQCGHLWKLHDAATAECFARAETGDRRYCPCPSFRPAASHTPATAGQDAPTEPASNLEPALHAPKDVAPRCTPSSLSGCRGDTVHVPGCRYAQPSEPPAQAQQDDERDRYGHTEADHEAVGACRRPSAAARVAASATEYPRGSDLAVAFERGWDAALAARPSADTDTLRARIEALCSASEAVPRGIRFDGEPFPATVYVSDLRAALDNR